MGIQVLLVEESGTEIRMLQDQECRLNGILPMPDPSTPDVLDKIDPYGDTIFNYLQADALLRELQPLLDEARDKPSQEVVEGLIGMVRELASTRHVYLVFRGD